MLSFRSDHSLVLLFIILLSFWSIAWLDPYRDRVSDGNKKYYDRDYKEAKKSYKKAEDYVPRETDKLKLAFNKGNADYMLGKYRDAITNYEKAVQSEDPEVQKKAFFNMGNSYLKMKKYDDAVKSFINALKIDPHYDKAKKNIEHLLKEQKKQEQEKQKNDNNSNDQKKDGQNNRDREDRGNNDQSQKQQKTNLNKEQRQNLLKEMQRKPVRRQKGSSYDKRYLEKYW